MPRESERHLISPAPFSSARKTQEVLSLTGFTQADLAGREGESTGLAFSQVTLCPQTASQTAPRDDLAPQQPGNPQGERDRERERELKTQVRPRDETSEGPEGQGLPNLTSCPPNPRTANGGAASGPRDPQEWKD